MAKSNPFAIRKTGEFVDAGCTTSHPESCNCNDDEEDPNGGCCCISAKQPDIDQLDSVTAPVEAIFRP